MIGIRREPRQCDVTQRGDRSGASVRLTTLLRLQGSITKAFPRGKCPDRLPINLNLNLPLHDAEECIADITLVKDFLLVHEIDRLQRLGYLYAVLLRPRVHLEVGDRPHPLLQVTILYVRTLLEW